MPERFKVVCIPCKALYKCSAFFEYHTVLHSMVLDAGTSLPIKSHLLQWVTYNVWFSKPVAVIGFEAKGLMKNQILGDLIKRDNSFGLDRT